MLKVIAKVSVTKVIMPNIYTHILDHNFYDSIPTDGRIRKILSLAYSVAPTDMIVLIVGEPGTRKEMVAKVIHANSKRRNGRFMIINCDGAQESSLDIEFFGHEYDTFAGTMMRRIGKLEQATGGTVFLDEIGEIYPLLQAKLLRVLQDREIQRIGGTTSIPIDTRIIASTSKNLEIAVKAGKFREDLFYRINTFRIVIPPLRQCKEDIQFLIKYLLELKAKKKGKLITTVSNEALKLLMKYDWPGNIQELENVIEKAVMLEASDVLQSTSLPIEILSNYNDLHCQSENDILPLEEVEKQAIMHAMKITGNNIQQAAKALGVNRATVYRKLGKYKSPEKQ